MKAWDTIETVATDEGMLELKRLDNDWLITQDNRVVMSSRYHLSEIALAQEACAGLMQRSAPRVLVAGLGMGFTLRAALDVLPGDAEVVTAELNPVVARWNQGPLASLSQHALEDERVLLRVVNVMDLIGEAAASKDPDAKFDAIILDLYEGPFPPPHGQEDMLFGKAAITRSHKALRPKGCYAVWSETVVPSFEKNVKSCGYKLECQRPKHKGPRHIVYLSRT